VTFPEWVDRCQSAAAPRAECTWFANIPRVRGVVADGNKGLSSDQRTFREAVEKLRMAAPKCK
jgi:hypothetical protein